MVRIDICFWLAINCIIFTNLISVFLSENKLLNKMISFDLILGICLSVYLIYILPDEQLKTIRGARTYAA